MRYARNGYIEHSQVLDFLTEDDQLNVYAGKLEVRPPACAHTTGLEVAALVIVISHPDGGVKVQTGRTT
jgi:hypothetical protein